MCSTLCLPLGSVDYVDLAVIDLSKAATPEGRAQLVPQVRKALATQGFFYAINHGYTQEQASTLTNRIFDIANLTFDGVAPEEKKYYTGDTEVLGAYKGYKPRNYWKIDKGVDQIEHYNTHRIVVSQEHPRPLRPFISEMEDFARHNHFNVLHPVLRLLALGLELPEDTLVKTHNFDAKGETSDIGGVTILWSQPIAALQILSTQGKWQWVKHMDNALVINSGDVLQFLSGDFYKPTIHRVVQPPVDQRNQERLGAFYFTMPDDDLKLVPYAESPVLQREGIHRLCEDEEAPTMEEWRKGRAVSYGRAALTVSTEKGVEEEVVRGVTVKHYN
ncbi:Clavaminate synthase-like protein [Athelia psychrophila]|uniref:Clavaminate synthase-like protein n=1 Tax=Athelia psychrophila TaxID=1759441 RepID=A0A166WT57_9AGAM|nr:Clavaminate synthase-like protein [Fibularhizoctonia sp. CBS 109695]